MNSAGVLLKHSFYDKGGGAMKRTIAIISAILICLLLLACGGGPQLPEQWEISLVPSKGYTGDAKGTAVINTKTGTDISVKVSGLEPGGLYTIFFVNVKSQMFEGIGPVPHVLAVNANGEASLEAKMSKNIYKKFIRIAIYLNPGDKPIENPVGVKATLGAIIKEKKPTMVLEGKLR
jgi:hypothetical protein